MNSNKYQEAKPIGFMENISLHDDLGNSTHYYISMMLFQTDNKDIDEDDLQPQSFSNDVLEERALVHDDSTTMRKIFHELHL